MSAPEKMEFRTELKQLLHLITHSLYSNKRVFLRELVSNASDAIHKLRFDSLDSEALLENDKDFKIHLIPDAKRGRLVIRDNGIGMSRATVIENLGTVARSGTKAYLEKVKEATAANRPDLIGQFGVGFYSAFMVADQVEVISRQAGDPADAGVRWVSDGQGDFTVEPVNRPARGTEVILHLKEEDKDEFTNPYTLEHIVKQFSDFIEIPVVLHAEKPGDEKEADKAPEIEERVINSQKALWLRPKSEITPEEYNAFYTNLTGDPEPPAKVIHYSGEGSVEFKVLFFIPSKRPFGFDYGEPKVGPRLYVQRVLIMENCEELLPRYMRFVAGLVDCPDLPLNISREILQHNKVLETIRKDATKEVLKALRALKEDDAEKYRAFFDGLGGILKEGVREDFANREQVAGLFLFPSLKTPPADRLTLDQYIEAAPKEQEEIFFLTGDSDALLRSSPIVEAYKAKDRDVLFLTEPVDEYMLPGITMYKGKKLRSADAEKAPDEVAEKAEATGPVKNLLELMKKWLPEVSDVRASSRLVDSACCLVTPAGAMSAHLERMLERMGHADAPKARRILEVNGAHKAVTALADLAEKSPEDGRLVAYSRLLLEEAMLAEGTPLPEPAAHAQRISELIARDASR